MELKEVNFAVNSLSNVIPVRLDKQHEKDEIFALIP